MDFKPGEPSFQSLHNFASLDVPGISSTYKSNQNLSALSPQEKSSLNNLTHLSSQSLSFPSSQTQPSLEGVSYPAYDKNVNYYHEFWRMYLENEVLISQMKEYVSKAREIHSKIIHEQSQYQDSEADWAVNGKKDHFKKKRRHANEIEKTYTCPYQDCHRSYGSEVSLNLHIKLKHNGGNKTEREKLARIIIEAKVQNKQLPEINLNLPPGFLENLDLEKFFRSKDKDKEKTQTDEKAIEHDLADGDIYKMASLASIDLPHLLDEISKAMELNKLKNNNMSNGEIKTKMTGSQSDSSKTSSH